jgi:Tfp pilus assembly PilM family ATPase
MILSRARNRTPICLDVGARVTRAVQLRHIDDQWVIDAATSFRSTVDPAEFGNEDAARLCGVIERQGLVGRRIVALLPASLTDASAFELPARGDEDVYEQIARMELARTRDAAPDQMVSRWWRVPPPDRAGDSVQAMGLTCRRDVTEQWVDAFEAARLAPMRLDGHLSCAAQIVRCIAPEPDAISAAVDIGWSASRIVVVAGGQPIYHRQSADLGLATVCKRLVDRQSMTMESAESVLADPANHASRHSQAATQLCAILSQQLLSETDAAMSYAEHRYRDRTRGQILLYGGGASIEALTTALAMAESSARVVLPNDLCEGANKPLSAIFTSATALALAETD